MLQKLSPAYGISHKLWNKLRASIFLLKSYFNNLLSFYKAGAKLNSSECYTKPCLVFDLQRCFERYTYNLIKFAILSGYQVKIKHNFSFIAGIKGYGKFIFNEPVKLVFYHKRRSHDILVTDQQQKQHAYRKRVYLDYDYFSPKPLSQALFQCSFSMHPLIYYNGSFGQLEHLRLQTRKIKVVFSGNYQEESYQAGSMYIEDLFQKSPRPATIQLLLHELKASEKIVLIPEEYKNISTKDFQNKLTFIDTSVQRIDNKKWLEFIADADFFLAPCGVYMPFSHNIIEAMAVGTIPITEYPEMFRPGLQDGHTCLAYSGKQDAVRAVRQALALSDDQVKQMRHQVIDYYLQYLAPESFGKRLEDKEENDLTMPYNVELHSTRLFARYRGLQNHI
jgi:hypothetical protein